MKYFIRVCEILDGLEQVAKRLNGAPLGDLGAPWTQAADVVGVLTLPKPRKPVLGAPRRRQGSGATIATAGIPPTGPQWAVAKFNGLARRARAGLLTVGPVPRNLRAPGELIEIQTPLARLTTRRLTALLPGGKLTPLQRVLWDLYRYVFTGDGWKRLKQCQRCGKWFADRSDGRLRKFCSQACKDRRWTWVARSKKED